MPHGTGARNLHPFTLGLRGTQQETVETAAPHRERKDQRGNVYHGFPPIVVKTYLRLDGNEVILPRLHTRFSQ